MAKPKKRKGRQDSSIEDDFSKAYPIGGKAKPTQAAKPANSAKSAKPANSAKSATKSEVKSKSTKAKGQEPDNLEDVIKAERKRIKPNAELLEEIATARGLIISYEGVKQQEQIDLLDDLNKALMLTQQGIEDPKTKLKPKFLNDLVFHLANVTTYHTSEDKAALKDPTPAAIRFINMQTAATAGKPLLMALKAFKALAILVSFRGGREKAREYLHNEVSDIKQHKMVARQMRLFKSKLPKENKRSNFHRKMDKR